MNKPVFQIVLGAIILTIISFMWACGSKDTKKPSASDSVQRTTDSGNSTKSRSSSPALPKEEPTWEAACSDENTAFKVKFRSANGDVTNDDMTIAVQWSDGKTTSVPLKPGWFMPDIEIASDIPNSCTRIVGSKLPDNRILLWVIRNGRPGADELALVLLDTSMKRILDVHDEVGELANNPIIVSGKIGPRILLSRESRQSNDGGEFDVPEWMDVRVVHDHISLQWQH